MRIKFVYVSWIVIFFAAILIFGVMTGPAVYGLAKAFSVLAGILALICGAGGIFGCWASPRTVFIKTWNSVLLIAFSYGVWQAAILFVDFLTESYEKGRFAFLGNMLSGGLGFFVILVTFSIALTGLSDEFGEKAFHSVFGTLAFIVAAASIEKEILERILEKFTGPVKTGILILLIVSFIISLVLFIKKGFQFYDWENIGKMWLSVGLIIAFCVFMKVVGEAMKMVLLPIVLLIGGIAVIGLIAKEK